MGSMSLRLTDDLENRLAEAAKIEGKPRSELVREALSDFLRRRERERFMAEMIAEAKKAYSDPEIRREAIERRPPRTRMGAARWGGIRGR